MAMKYSTLKIIWLYIVFGIQEEDSNDTKFILNKSKEGL